MDIPSIFCPRCTTLLLRENTCPNCGWERGGDGRGVGQIAWRQTLPGRPGSPYVTPAADDEQIFVPVEDDRPTTTIHALDLASGALAWSFSLPEGRVTRHLVLAGGLLLVAPEDSRVLAEKNGELLALNPADGSVAWRTRLPAHSLSPPAALDGRLVVPGSSGEGYILSLEDGSLLHTTGAMPPWLPIPAVPLAGAFYAAGRSSQIVRLDLHTGQVDDLVTLGDRDQWFDKGLATDGRLILAPNWNRRLYAVNPANGAIAWEADLERGVSSPPAAGQHLYVGLKRQPDEEGRRVYGLAAYDLEAGDLAWFCPTERHIETPPLVLEEVVCITSRDGRLAAVSTETGEPIWAVELDHRPQVAPLAAGSQVITGTRAGEIVAVTRQAAAVNWDALEDPESYRQREEWAAAGTAAALLEAWNDAAGDFLKAGKPALAARLYARGGAWEPAAAAYLAAGDKGGALRAYTEGGELESAAYLLVEEEQFAEAGHLFRRLKDWAAAAENFEKAGMLAQAAPLWAKAGQPQQAVDLLLQLDRPEDAAGVLTAAGQVGAAADLLHEAGKIDQAAQLLEEAGRYGQAAAIWQNQGKEEEALRLYLLNQDLEPALDIALARQDWALIRRLAFDLGRYELEAEASLQMAAAASGNARFDHFAAAGQALVRAARALMQEHTENGEPPAPLREAAAALWEQAIAAFEQGLESEETLRQCRREVRRLRRWPELTLDISAVRELVAGEYHSLLVKVANTGFGIAQGIHLRVRGSLFDGDIHLTQHLKGLRPGSTENLLLRVKPQPEVVGSAVPLDLELSYQLPNDEIVTRQVRGQVPVRQREPGRTPSPLDPLDDKPAIGIYQETPEVEIKRAAASAPPGLRQNMVDYLSESEIRTICFDMGLDFNLLPGRSLADKIRELIIYCEKRKLIPDLLEQCAAVNHTIDWHEE